MRILVVDDTRIIVSVVEAILTQDQHDVFTAADGREGYAAYSDLQPDMVVTDIEMPWQDGLSMMEAIRRIQPAVFTLYMTGNPGPYQQRLKEEAEIYAAGLLHKPFTRSELLCSVREVVARASRMREPNRPPTSSEGLSSSMTNPVKHEVASLSAAHFQREVRYAKNDRVVAGGVYDDGLRAGGRG